MDANAAYEHLVERYLEEIAQSPYPSISLMNRVERMISSEEQLETYAAVLMKKVEEESDSRPSDDMLNRLERVLNALQRNQQTATS